MMTPQDMQNIIFVDSRQQDGKHEVTHTALERMGYTLLMPPAGLCVGDYSALGSRYVVDTKANISELANNLSEYDVNRFEWEVARAQYLKVILIVVVTAMEFAHSLTGWLHKQCAICDYCELMHNTSAVCPIDSELKPHVPDEVLIEISKICKKYSGTVRFEFVETDLHAAERIRYWLFMAENK